MTSISDAAKTAYASFWQVAKDFGLWRFYAYLGCYFIVLLAALLRIEYIIQYNPMHEIWSDPARHWEQGIDTLRFDPMSMTDPILYQLYIGMLGKLTLKIPGLVAFYTSILAIIGPWLWYRFLRELLPSKFQALLGWALISIIPSWISIYGYFMQETLLIPLLGASLYATWRARRKQDVASFAWMIVFWSLAGLTRGVAIPMAAVAGIWVWTEQGQKVRKAVVSLLILGLILGPLTYRAYRIVHVFAPSGMALMNQVYARSGKKWIEMTYDREGAVWGYGFGSPATGSKPFAPFSDWTTQREGPVTAFVDLDEGTRDWDALFEREAMTWGKYSWILKENIIFLLQSESWPDSNTERLIGLINNITRWIWPPLLIIAIIWTALVARRMKGAWLFPSMIIAWFFVQAVLPISVNEGRYRKPFEGLIVVYLILLASRTAPIAFRCRKQESILVENPAQVSI
ncbi:MAG TPA: glycosyltransferase family 39 protein [Cellvibrionaceae bacterium]